MYVVQCHAVTIYRLVYGSTYHNRTRWFEFLIPIARSHVWCNASRATISLGEYLILEDIKIMSYVSHPDTKIFWQKRWNTTTALANRYVTNLVAKNVIVDIILLRPLWCQHKRLHESSHRLSLVRKFTTHLEKIKIRDIFYYLLPGWNQLPGSMIYKLTFLGFNYYEIFLVSTFQLKFCLS